MKLVTKISVTLLSILLLGSVAFGKGPATVYLAGD